jgi:hypothetical protein
LSTLLCAALAPAVRGACQNAAKPTLAGLQRQLASKKQELTRRDAEYQLCTDSIIAYHLGIGSDADKLLELRDGERDRARDALERELTESLEAVSGSNAELERLRATLATLRAEAAARPAVAPETTWIGAAPPAPATQSTSSPSPEPEVAEEPPVEEPPATEPPAAAPASETKAPAALIRGSTDHHQLGFAFYHAGMYEKARHELEQAAAPDDAPLSTMFCLARTYEKLGELVRADSEFLRIEALDEARGAGGGWAAAARTARQHMSWMRDHGTWHAPALTPAKRK